jgi:hypothetical protein
MDQHERLAGAAVVLVESAPGGGLYAGRMDTKVSLGEKLAAFDEPWRR